MSHSGEFNAIRKGRRPATHHMAGQKKLARKAIHAHSQRPAIQPLDANLKLHKALKY